MLHWAVRSFHFLEPELRVQMVAPSHMWRLQFTLTKIQLLTCTSRIQSAQWSHMTHGYTIGWSHKCQRINAFKLRCWRKLLRVPWTERRSNQSIIKKVNPDYSLEGLLLKQKLQYFDHLGEELTYCIRPWCWERSKAKGEGGSRGWDGWMASPMQWTWTWANSWG